MYDAKAYSAASAASPLAPDTIQRRDTTEQDVQIDILFCGICHSDLHYARDEWHDFMPAVYPCVPGHEIVGRVVSVTYGGYSESIVVDQRFVLRVPTNLDPAGVAPLLCAGITTYSPIRRWGNLEGKKVGVVGLGGLGHMGVKFAKAFGARVAVFTTSPGKADDAKRLGADEVIVSTNPDEMERHAGTFDFILDTVSAPHDLNAYLHMLGVDGNLTLVGAPDEPLPVAAFALLFGRKSISGSLIGGIAETQEMLDFCGEHGITADVEVIPIQRINEAYDRMVNSDVKYRFSIDMASLKGE
jgi:uncharacterized zinc-type alcohol dehydrogenase-like protein